VNPAIAIAVAVGGYLIGSISFARIMAHRLVPGAELTGTTLTWSDDDRGFVTEQISATTVGQAAGRRFGCLTGSFDILKAFIPVLLLHLVFPDDPYDIIGAVAITAGHNLPAYHRFKGGRGTSTMIGSLLVLDPLAIPITIALGYLIGLGVFRDILLAHHAGWIVLLPFWFAAWGRWDMVLYGLGVNFFRWVVSGPEIREYLALRRSGELRSRQFHEAIEQSHVGYFHKYLRRWGVIKYGYMRDGA
jgi:glycerol-3-phosphate acyltransferase PlsY